ncbi:MAG: hypothetical protein LBH24_06040 [Clostridiales bacterium]|nr:hypothetical protein [Clostridiales bacterium]
MAQDVAILDFGSSKITVLIGERGINNTICLKGMGQCDYAGFGGGEWFEPAQLSYVLGHAITNAETNSGTKIESLYIGVPGEFTTNVVKELSMGLNKRRKVTEADVDALYNTGNDFYGQSEFAVVNIQPVYFELDDDKRTLVPYGNVCAKLGTLASYTLAETKFTKFVTSLIKGLGIISMEFVSSCLAEVLFLFSEEERDKSVVLFDIGYITSNVIVGKGDGLLALNNFSMGGGHIAGDLAKCLGISFTQAESLKRKVILSLSAGDGDVYEIGAGDTVRTFKASEVNEIVVERLKIIAKAITKCLKLCPYEYPDFIPYYLTGGGISYIRGAKEVMSKQLGRSIEIIAPDIPQINKPNLSASWGLLDLAIRSETPVKKGFFAKLFHK